MVQGRSTIGGMAHSLNIPFLAFVLALGVVVKRSWSMEPTWRCGSCCRRATVWPRCCVAVLAAGLLNLVNNLPAILLLAPSC